MEGQVQVVLKLLWQARTLTNSSYLLQHRTVGMDEHKKFRPIGLTFTLTRLANCAARQLIVAQAHSSIDVAPVPVGSVGG